ncbi:copper resistance protein NlpE N-terminal domain-containing protein [Aliifodinibius salicampi]|uniref:Copper resistance protein NlpE N-terminal domain-containing protein n=1 Tax=Fodinibius salicampi TaxID=1920655 RepID=A0ABT3PZI1_9BACT|nr:copper resistance protein NlpE N-terminal domain-containing protein [Fodinibius salicampi]MCW9713225.1 copper resistance protein NlpE N-terminal domain-containing protein [Fodinibius salicampi]
MKNRIVLFIAIIALFTACDNSNNNFSSTVESLEGSTYSSIIPCADCEGIAFELTLKENQKYESSSVYIGESSRPFIEKGTWSVKEDTLLALEEKSGTSKEFTIDDSLLVMLDQQGKEITGSLTDRYILDKQPLKTAERHSQWTELQKEGVDFRGAGNEPFWRLKIDFDNNTRFEVLDGDTVVISTPEIEKDSTSKARLIKAETESGSFTALFSPIGCTDSMSGILFTHRVIVEIGEETYRGCGSMITDRYKLHDFWTLHSLNNAEISEEAFLRQLPALQINLNKQQVHGHTGCNQLNGKLTIGQDSLSFGELITTKVACQDQDARELESQFKEALSETNKYDISNERLLLLHDEDTVMTFHRSE